MNEYERYKMLEHIATKLIKILHLFCFKDGKDTFNDLKPTYFCFDYFDLIHLESKDRWEHYIAYRLGTIRKFIEENNYEFIYEKESYQKKLIKILKEKAPVINDIVSDEDATKIKDILLGKPNFDCPSCPYKEKGGKALYCINCQEVN